MKKIVLFLNLIIMLFILQSCSSFERSSEKINISSKSDIYKILYYASLAGSSHNSQPWKVEVFGEDSILVYADFSRKLTVVDNSGRELFISLGAFMENLSIAANCYGYQTSFRFYKPEENTKSIATVHLIKSRIEKSDFNLSDLEQRTTLRIPFDTIPVSKPDWEKLVSPDISNIHFVSSATEEGKFIAKNELSAYEKQSTNEQANDELVKWMRFSNKDAKEKRDGLTIAGMGIKGIRGFIVRNFLNPEDLKKESFINQSIDKTKQLVEKCGGWIILTQPNDDISGWVMTGMLYEQINIYCRNLYIGFHPMNQITEEGYENEISKLLNIRGKILFVARIGYVKEYPAPVSLRRSVDSFTSFK